MSRATKTRNPQPSQPKRNEKSRVSSAYFKELCFCADLHAARKKLVEAADERVATRLRNHRQPKRHHPSAKTSHLLAILVARFLMEHEVELVEKFCVLFGKNILSEVN